MLGAVTFGHESFQPVIQAIIELAEHAAKDPWTLSEPTPEAAGAQGARRCAGPRRPGRGLSRAGQGRAARQGRCGAQPDGRGACRRWAGYREGQVGVPRPGGGRGAQRHPGHRHADRRPRHQDGPADHRRGRRAAPRARLRAVHPRRDAGVLRGHTRHRAGRADHRRARGRVPRALHAALQLPAVFGGRGRPHGLPGPARGRARQTRLAGDPSAAAGEGEVPLHAADGLRDHREQRLVPRWPRYAAARSR